MLNRLCSLHLPQEHANTHTHTHWECPYLQTLPCYLNRWQKIKDDWWVESGCVEGLRCVIVIWGQKNHCQRLSIWQNSQEGKRRILDIINHTRTAVYIQMSSISVNNQQCHWHFVVISCSNIDCGNVQPSSLGLECDPINAFFNMC